jgi:formate dehydrogenase subunit gamma
MEGAFEAMWDGTVDANWAKEHHNLWVEGEIGKDAAASTRGMPPPSRQVAKVPS